MGGGGGGFHALLTELCSEDHQNFRKFLGMDKKTFLRSHIYFVYIRLVLAEIRFYLGYDLIYE